MGQSIPFACQDWASTKAAYRFLSNERVNERNILSGYFAATADRFKVTGGTTLVLQDTTMFSYKRERPGLVGYTGKATMRTGYKGNGLQNSLTQCGILMHSSLAVTTEGLPLGLSAIKFWTRSKFKGCTALKRHVNPTRVPIEEKESYRWLENMRRGQRIKEGMTTASSSSPTMTSPMPSYWAHRVSLARRSARSFHCRFSCQIDSAEPAIEAIR